MTKEQSNELIKWGLILGGAYLVITKLGNIFNGGTPAPGITTGLNPVFTETISNHRIYTYTISDVIPDNLASDIYNAVGLVNVDFTAVMDAFHSCTTQGDVFSVVQHFKNNYDADMWTYLKTGAGIVPGNGLSSSHLNEINDYVNSLPL